MEQKLSKIMRNVRQGFLTVAEARKQMHDICDEWLLAHHTLAHQPDQLDPEFIYVFGKDVAGVREVAQGFECLSTFTDNVWAIRVSDEGGPGLLSRIMEQASVCLWHKVI